MMPRCLMWNPSRRPRSKLSLLLPRMMSLGRKAGLKMKKKRKMAIYI